MGYRRAVSICTRLQKFVAEDPADGGVRSHEAAVGLSLLRMGVASTLLVQLLLIAPAAGQLSSPFGIVQGSITDLIVTPGLPRVEWFMAAGASLKISSATILRALLVGYGVALYFLLIGVRTRLAALIAWLLFLSLKTTGFAAAYGAHEFGNILLFYCIVLPVGCLSVFGRATPSVNGLVGRLILRCHLCLVYFTSGWQKAQGEQWWNGEAIWRAVMRPEVSPPDWDWIAAYPSLLIAGSVGTLIIEMGYPLAVASRRTRFMWLSATILLHVGIAIALKLWVFSALMITFNLGAFSTIKGNMGKRLP